MTKPMNFLSECKWKKTTVKATKMTFFPIKNNTKYKKSNKNLKKTFRSSASTSIISSKRPIMRKNPSSNPALSIFVTSENKPTCEAI